MFPQAALQRASLQEDAAAAAQAPQADIGSQADDLPLVAATGVALSKAHDVLEMKFPYHPLPSDARVVLMAPRSFMVAVRAASAKSCPREA